VGRILAQSWKLGSSLCRMVEQHHAPSADDGFTQLIALADFAGGCFYPYPQQAAYPMVHLLQDSGAALSAPTAGQESSAENPPPRPAVSLESGAALRAFLPPGLLEKLTLPLDELIALGRLLAPVVHRLADNIRKSV
jgi:hypothetical protein